MLVLIVAMTYVGCGHQVAATDAVVANDVTVEVTRRRRRQWSAA